MNVVCITLDTLRKDHLGCYGNDYIKTPNLDRFAKNGAKFKNGSLGSYPCMPARQDLWTGRLNFFWRGWSPLEYDQEDLITELNQANKTTMLVTDHYHLWQNGSGNYHFNFNGTEMIRGQEIDNWKTDSESEIHYPASKEKLNRNWHRYAKNTASFSTEEDYFAAKVFQKSMDWIDQNKSQEDFFLMIDCFDPHEPFDPPKKYVDLYDPDYSGESVIWPRYGNPENLTEEELKHIHALYCGEISYVDHWFGRFYDHLEKQGLLEDTMVIVTSDHGFLFGEHNWIGKHARIIYQGIAETPLLINAPKIQPGTEYNELVQMADLTPTILDAFGIKTPETMQGKSLTPLWDENFITKNSILDRKGLLFGVFGGPVYCTDGELVLVKHPIEGNFPLYWYTKSHFNNWDFGQKNYPEESRERLSYWDGNRFAVQYEQVQPKHAAPLMIRDESELKAKAPRSEDELYNLKVDHGQKNNIADKEDEILQGMKTLMVKQMKELGVPEEQYTRLGLEDYVNES